MLASVDSTALLHEAGLKATSSRLALLSALAASTKPLTAEELYANVSADQATIYRTLKDFVKASIVRQVDFQHGHSHYELATDHHHHVICQKCEKVEEVKELSLKIPEIKNFTILHHSLEFYGLCNGCNS